MTSCEPRGGNACSVSGGVDLCLERRSCMHCVISCPCHTHSTAVTDEPLQPGG